MNYWQIEAGSDGRDYSEYFLRFGMAFVGGDEQKETMKYVNIGDVVILKKGLSKILAAGKVVQRNGMHRGEGDKEWLRYFDGWELDAYCYVDWKMLDDGPVNVTGLARRAICGVNQHSPKQVAENILKSGKSMPYVSEPVDKEQVTDEGLLKFLIKEGLRVSAADDLTRTFAKIRLLANYYYENSWDDVREHEARTFLVVPLLLALGWSEQQLKIELPCEGGKVDIACFRRNYNGSADDCVAIIETKSFSTGLYYTKDQAVGYSQNFPSCKVIAVTNGFTYKIFNKECDGSFKDCPSAYINLLDPKAEYPLDPKNIGGALKAIKWLLPNNLI